MTTTAAFNLALARQAHTGYRRCIDWAFNLPPASLISDGSWTRRDLEKKRSGSAVKHQVHRSNRVSTLSPEKLAYKRAYNKIYAQRLKQQALDLTGES